MEDTQLQVEGEAQVAADVPSEESSLNARHGFENPLHSLDDAIKLDQVSVNI